MRNLPTEPARPRLRGAIVSILLFGAVATACAVTASDSGPRFDDESTDGAAVELSCMKHQPQAPGSRYTDASHRRTDELLALLRYYTANGGKPYCDGKSVTDVDRQWVDLYLQLGADRGNVTALVDGAR